MKSTWTDPRDGQTYRTVEINGQVWLAENLKYKSPVQRFNNWTVEKKNFIVLQVGNQRILLNMVVSTPGIMLLKLVQKDGTYQVKKSLKHF